MHMLARTRSLSQEAEAPIPFYSNICDLCDTISMDNIKADNSTPLRWQRAPPQTKTMLICALFLSVILILQHQVVPGGNTADLNNKWPISKLAKSQTYPQILLEANNVCECVELRESIETTLDRLQNSELFLRMLWHQAPEMLMVSHKYPFSGP